MSNDNHQTALEPHAATAVALPLQQRGLLPAVGAPPTQCPHNFDLTSFDGKAALLNAANPATISCGQYSECEIRAVHYLIRTDEIVDEESGECRVVPRVTLIDAQGERYVTTSAYMPARLFAAMELFGKEDWARGIVFHIKEVKGKRGRVYHQITVNKDND